MEGVTRDVQLTFNQRNEVVREVFTSGMPLGSDWIEFNDAAKGFIGLCPVPLVFEPSPVLVAEVLVRLDQVVGVHHAVSRTPLEALLQVPNLGPIDVVGVEVPTPTLGEGLVAFEPEDRGALEDDDHPVSARRKVRRAHEVRGGVVALSLIRISGPTGPY